MTLRARFALVLCLIIALFLPDFSPLWFIMLFGSIAFALASVLAKYRHRKATSAEVEEFSILSKTEQDIVTRSLSGESVKEIAYSRHVGESTIRKHLSNSYKKLSVTNMNELLRLAARNHYREEDKKT